MTTRPSPFLWLLVGPNGAGKSTYYERKVRPRLNAPFINADLIARKHWPSDPAAHAYEAAEQAAKLREEFLKQRRSFVAESVFSHLSKLDFLRAAKRGGYVLWMTFLHLGSPELAVARVAQRVRAGGHDVPREKIRGRYSRIPGNVHQAIVIADKLFVVDNSGTRPFRTILVFDTGVLTYQAGDLPDWAGELIAPITQPEWTG